MSEERAVQRRPLLRASLGFALLEFPRGREPAEIGVERDTPGFLWNRLQMALVGEAVHIVEQGVATPEDVDEAMR